MPRYATSWIPHPHIEAIEYPELNGLYLTLLC